MGIHIILGTSTRGRFRAVLNIADFLIGLDTINERIPPDIDGLISSTESDWLKSWQPKNIASHTI